MRGAPESCHSLGDRRFGAFAMRSHPAKELPRPQRSVHATLDPDPLRKATTKSMQYSQGDRPSLSASRTRSTRKATLVGGSVLLGLLASCGSSSPEGSSGGGGAVLSSGQFFFEDPNFGGTANSLSLESVSFGRLVDVFGLDSSGNQVLMASDYVIDQEITDQPGDWLLETNAVTGQQAYIVLRNVDDADERADFLAFVRAAGEGLDIVQVREPDDSLVSMVPRNSALVLRFDDLLDPGSLNQNTIFLLAGEPPTAPTNPQPMRIVPSQHFGAELGNGSFFPTRVILDLTVSELESSESPIELAVNSLGLDPSTQPNLANHQLQLGTRTNSTVGITNVVRNLSGSTLSTTGNGPVDNTATTEPVIRPFRSGGALGVIADPFNGFLVDEDAPVLIGSTMIELLDAPVQLTANGGVDSLDFILPRLQFSSNFCSSAPEPGDVIQQGSVFAEVVEAAGQPNAGLVLDVRVRLVSFPDSFENAGEWETNGLGIGAYETEFDPNVDSDRTGCFVQVFPVPSGSPEMPSTGVNPSDPSFTLRFSEAMEPTSLTAFDSLTMTRSPFVSGAPPSSADFVIGSIGQSQDLRSVTFNPDVALSHLQGFAEPYFIRISDPENDTFPPTDLAGNAVGTVPEIVLSVDPSAPTQLNGGRVSRFSSIDEDDVVGAEWGGQVLIDTARQALRPRPVIRSQVVLDNNQPLLALQTFVAGGVVTPHSPFGSRLQTLWRYSDAGFSLTDQQDQSIDIEGLAWRPSGASITADSFSQFEIRLSHSRRMPDEVIDPATAWPQFNASGLLNEFAVNRLAQDPDRPDVEADLVVHPRELGYVVDQGDLFQGSTGVALIPFPLNSDDSFDDNIWFTWRDPRIRERAPNQRNGGTEPFQSFLARGLPTPPNIVGYRAFYARNQAQTIALPLMMEFRVFPDLSVVGQNAWDFNIAANSSAQPFFRAFATGGSNASGNTVFVDPDSTPTANGGFNPASTPAGMGTDGRDNVVHHGAIDYITRVSFAHSVWFEAEIANEEDFGGRRFESPAFEPDTSDQPLGTELQFEYRGADNLEYFNDELDFAMAVPAAVCPTVVEGGRVQVGTGVFVLDNDGDAQDTDQTPGIPDFQADAFLLDLYGDYYNDADQFTMTHGTVGPTGGLINCTVPNTPSPARNTNPWPIHGPLNANPGIEFSNGDSWKFSVDDIEDSRFYQVRMIFFANPETGQTPEVSAFALTWTQN